MNESIRQRVLALNPWLAAPETFEAEVRRRVPDPYLARHVDLDDVTEPRNARLVVGPRQAGKSTLVWHALASREPRSVLFLNAEEALVRDWCESAAGLLADLHADFPAVRTILLDEAQHLREAGLLVKGLVDAGRELTLFVTGSSSFHLAARTRESLAGRAERHVLLPFSLAEVAAHDASPVPAVRAEQAVSAARRMLVVGGYPRAWLGEQPQRVLSDLVEAFVIRDASDRFRIQRPDAFRRLLQLAAGQTGQLANYSEWAALLGIAVSTVRDYVGILEESWVLKLLPAFAGGRRRELTSAPRLHFYDPGIRNALLGAFSDDVDRRPDRGALVEALVFAELAKTVPRDWTLHYWRAKGGAEVDFVLARGDRLIAVEAKAGPRPRLSRSARSFLDAYRPTHFVVVTGLSDPAPPPEQEGPTTVLRLGLVRLATEIRRLTADVPR